MSSMYAMVFGNTLEKLNVARLLGFDPAVFPRYRDLWLETVPDRKDELVMVLYTRTGGGNRDEYADENEELRQLPGFIVDEDDDYDSTYATFRYRVSAASVDQSWLPEHLRTEVEDYWGALLAGAGEPTKSGDRWRAALERLEKGVEFDGR